MPATDLNVQKCTSCEGTSPMSDIQIDDLLKELSSWQLTPDRKMITRSYRMRDFLAAIEFMQRIAEIAEKEDHHPDLHLTGYRNLRIDLSTHSIGGLSKNDFILASKIDQLPKQLKA